MDDSHTAPGVTRRAFLRGAGLVFTTLFLEACNRQARPRLTATSPPPTAAPAPTLTPPTVVTAPTLAPTAVVEAADLVLTHGHVITVDPRDTIAQAVAVRGDRIVAVGSDDQVRAYIDPQTQVLDLGGKTVTPGLIDAHNHLQVLGQLQEFYVPFMPPEIKNMDDLRAKLAEVVAQKPEGEWVVGYFFAVGERLPNRHDLDPVSPNHPVWLIQQGGHYGSCNTRALEAAGITAATPSPEGGLIEKDASGQPTGVFYNHRAMDVLRQAAPRATPEMTRGFITAAQPIFAACGVTTFHDNNVRGVDTVRSYFDTDREGKMLIRGGVYYTLEWPGDLQRALKEVEYYQGNGFMRFAGFKFLLDGQALMAYCHQPHNGVRWDMPTWEPQSFKDAVRALHDTGLQICVHCVGDAAVDLTLDAYEAAMNDNPRPDPRHRIEHCILSTPQATRRIKDLGVVVSTQPQFARLLKSRDRWVELFGEERTRRYIVTREWLEAGIPLALGSDAPTTPWLTPQATIFGAVRRINYSNETMGPEQCLTVQEALRAHTMGSAYAGFEEDVKGSIEVGKLADLVVWSEDPYTATLERLWQIPVAMTLIGGRVVYQV